MESAAKRKAASAASPENDSRPAKRQKGLDGAATPEGETKESTTIAGLKFLDSLRAAKDKTGRPIATHFLELPDKDEIPEYYDVIKLPISIGSMEVKLNAGGYPSLAQLESDCKRLVNNAKVYNDKKSIIYEDAERLRKTASNWMVRHNPAYKRPGYSALATPIPGEDPLPPSKPTPRSAAASTPSKVPAPAPDSTERPRRGAAAPPATPAPSKLRHSASAAPQEDEESADFAGKSFQHAQEQIITEMIEYTDQDLQIFQPFVNLPSRSLKDYYQVIKNPMSLSAVKKKIQGVVGRNPPNGVTLYKTWNALENDVALIWENAKDYNEDGSDIHNLAIEFEEVFKERLAEARANVEEPVQPKLKLNMSSNPTPKQTMKLKLGNRQSPASDPNTPAGRSSATPGFNVDSDALTRQQRHVQDSLGSKSSRPSSAAPVTKAAGSPSAAPNGIKSDVASPALNAIRPASTASDSQSQRLSVPAQGGLSTSQNPSRPTSGSPHPNGTAVTPGTAQNPATGGPYQPPQFPTPNYYIPPVAPTFDHFRTTPLKSLSTALIPKITLQTPTTLSLPPAFQIRKSLPASRTKTQISYTITLPPGNSFLNIIPHLPVALTGRAYRCFVSVNGVRVMESSRMGSINGMGGGMQGLGGDNTTGGQGKKKGEPLYEGKMLAGINRVEVEVIAEKEKKDGKDREGNEKEKEKEFEGGAVGGATATATATTKKDKDKEKDEFVDVEKCTIFAYLRR